jgi:hypothetical protein
MGAIICQNGVFEPANTFCSSHLDPLHHADHAQRMFQYLA